MPESECHLTLSDGSVAYVRHNTLRSEKNNVLFVHGLGESGLCFSEAFEYLPESSFNLLVPDLAGHGRSSSAADYSFDAHCTRLWMVIEALERRRSLSIAELSVVGHSMGGDLVTLLCYRDTERRITSFVNVEGDLTRSDVFISQRAVQANEGGTFPEWFKDFKELTVLEEWGRQHPECRRYYASLTFAREEAFLANAIELVRRNTSHQSPHGSEIGELYRRLRIPRCFCFGTRSLSVESLEYLRMHNLLHTAFPGSFHWVMTAQPDQFYSFLRQFLVMGSSACPV